MKESDGFFPFRDDFLAPKAFLYFGGCAASFAQKVIILPIVITIVFFVSSVLANESPRYNINASLDVSGHTIKARQQVIFTNNSSKVVKELYFHVYPHRKYTESEKRFIFRYASYFKINPYPEGFQSGDLRINSASLGKKTLKYIMQGDDKTILKVDLPAAVNPGESVSIDLDYEVTIPHSYGRFGWNKNIISLLRWYPILCVLKDDTWHSYPFYPYHQPYFSEASFYKLALTCPKNEVVVHSGALKEERDNQDGTKTIFVESEHPLRDFGLALSTDYKLESKEISGVKVNSYYLNGDEFYARQALDSACGLIEQYTRKFSPYPYREFNIAPSYLGYGGTQSSNLIFIDTRVYRLPKFLIRYFDFMISHETSHQWFYNLVGSDEYKEMFIDEGFNSYFVLKYLNDKYAPDASVMVIPKPLSWLIPNFTFERAQVDRYSFIAKNGLSRPVLGELSSFQEPTTIFTITYGKGSKIVDMLKYVMGDEAFERLLKRVFKDFKFKNISVLDLKQISSEEAGKDLAWFFDEWLITTKECDYALSRVCGDKLTLKNKGDIIMPLELKVELEDKKEIKLSWDGKEREKEFSVPGKIESAEIDPDRRILDLDRTNNSWKRKIDIRPVPLYYPIYEVPIFLKDDSYSFVFGPEVGGSELGIRSSFQKPQDNVIYLASTFNFNEERNKNLLGFQQRHLFGDLLRWGIEGFRYNDIHGRNNEDGIKLYLRKELWPISYGLFDENDHVTFYLLRDRDYKSPLGGGDLEDIRDLYYRKKQEAILGVNLKIGRYGPYPDPFCGWKLNLVLENAEHFLGGKDYFWRLSPELARYFSIAPGNTLATNVKLGLGYPADKGLYQLGGEKGLRGYGYKTINGSQAVMLNLEYRKDIFDNINLRFADNIITLKKIQGVGFFDIGKSWFRSFDDRSFKKDAGLGLRFHFMLCSFLEELILRLDIAQPINQPQGKRHYWVGFSQVF